MTIKLAGTYSSCWRISSPILVRYVPQSVHGSCSAGTPWLSCLRGRLAGNGLRPCPFFFGGLDESSVGGLAVGGLAVGGLAVGGLSIDGVDSGVVGSPAAKNSRAKSNN